MTDINTSQKLAVAREVQKCVAAILENDGEPLKDLELDEGYDYATKCFTQIVQKLRDGAVLTKRDIR